MKLFRIFTFARSKLKKMNIIVTGASRGIGFELVKQFTASSENCVVAISRNEARLNQLKMECLQQNAHAQLHLLPCDLTSNSLKDITLRLGKWVKTVHILINNAGLLINKPLAALNDAEMRSLFEINVFSPIRLVRALLPHFAAGAHVINVGSMGGFQGSAKFPGLAVYSASKAALANFSECLAEELKDKPVYVNCLALGAVQTEMLAQAFPDYEAPVQAEQMAAFIVDFAKNGHRFFNGKVLPVSVSTP